MSGTPSDRSTATSDFPPAFRYLIGVRIFGSFALMLQSVILGWQMYEFTRDPLSLGLVGLAEAAPALGLALFAGYVVDRRDPRKIISGVLLVSLSSMVIAWTAHGPFQLYVASFLTGLARSFYSPSFQSILPRLVAKSTLKRAIAAGTSAMKFASIVGPAAGGLLYGFGGENLAYGVGTAFLATALVFALLLRYDHGPYRRTAKNENSFVVELLAGLRFVFRNRLILSVMSLDMFAVLFGGIEAMLPIVASDVLHIGPQGLGFLRAAPAVGALGMTLWLVRRPVSSDAGKRLLQVVAGWGVCILAFAASRNPVLSCAILAVAGALDSVSMVIRGSIVQLASPEAMRGRIAAVNSIFIGSSNELGEFESGVTAKALGLIPSFYFGGIMTLVVVGVIARYVPELATLDLDKLTAE
ncbi:MAG: MFS transporter [Bdellovibrionales bacterium]|nr:MFS transporter [Bdellovibrionales bacterium]